MVVVDVGPVLLEAGGLVGVTLVELAGLVVVLIDVEPVAVLPLVVGVTFVGCALVDVVVVVAVTVVVPLELEVVAAPKVLDGSLSPQPTETSKHGIQTLKRKERYITYLVSGSGP